MTQLVRRALVVGAIALLPASAVAEVSDKAATIPEHWFFAVPGSLILFLAGRYRWWLGALLAIVPAFLVIGSFEMTRDPDIGPALWREQGLTYFASLWASDLLLLIALCAGIWRGLKREHALSARAPHARG
jgi:hypothetical protein